MKLRVWSRVYKSAKILIAFLPLTSALVLFQNCSGGFTSISPSSTSAASIAAAPTVTFTASQSSISSGVTSTLTWSSTNATSCTASGAWTGTQSTTGTKSVSPTATSTYTLTCTG